MGYPFEVILPEGLSVTGAVLSDHVKSADWAERQSAWIDRAPAEVVEQVRAKLQALLGM
jgi:mRNA interferase MazF